MNSANGQLVSKVWLTWLLLMVLNFYYDYYGLSFLDFLFILDSFYYLFSETYSLLCFSFYLCEFLIMETVVKIILLNSLVSLISSCMVLHFLKHVKSACDRQDAISSNFLKDCYLAQMPYIHFYQGINPFGQKYFEVKS